MRHKPTNHRGKKKLAQAPQKSDQSPFWKVVLGKKGPKGALQGTGPVFWVTAVACVRMWGHPHVVHSTLTSQYERHLRKIKNKKIRQATDRRDAFNSHKRTNESHPEYRNCFHVSTEEKERKCK